MPAAPSLPQFNEVAMAQLQAMGFPEIRCQKALLATGNSDPDAAMEWLFAHLEDPGESSLRTHAQYVPEKLNPQISTIRSSYKQLEGRFPSRRRSKSGCWRIWDLRRRRAGRLFVRLYVVSAACAGVIY